MSDKDKDPKPDPLASTLCVETTEHFIKIKETLLKIDSATKLCENDGYFSTASEDNIFKGEPPSTGEIPAAIAEEHVQLNNYHLKTEERDSIKILLCGSSDTWGAYSDLTNSMILQLVQESTDLPKLIGELNKTTTAGGKEFKTIADKIKKAYDQACTVQLAYNAMKQCMEKACNSEEKKKIDQAKLNVKLDEIGKAVHRLVKQAAEAHMSVVQAASIYALNDVAGLDALIAGLKPQAEQFKKDSDANLEVSSKKTVEWQKKYGEAIAAATTAKGEYGKSSTTKRGKEQAYCFMNKAPEDMQSQQKDLLLIFNPKTKNLPPKPGRDSTQSQTQ
jgi:hypothetical protein